MNSPTMVDIILVITNDVTLSYILLSSMLNLGVSLGRNSSPYISSKQNFNLFALPFSEIQVYLTVTLLLFPYTES
jgi:hypothetical protein